MNIAPTSGVNTPDDNEKATKTPVKVGPIPLATLISYPAKPSLFLAAKEMQCGWWRQLYLKRKSVH